MVAVTDARGLERPERPDGAVSGLLHDQSVRLAAARTHAAHEGHDVDIGAVLEGYDRALHPWIRGWRPGEIRETLRDRVQALRSTLHLMTNSQ